MYVSNVIVKILNVIIDVINLFNNYSIINNIIIMQFRKKYY